MQIGHRPFGLLNSNIGRFVVDIPFSLGFPERLSGDKTASAIEVRVGDCFVALGTDRTWSNEVADVILPGY